MMIKFSVSRLDKEPIELSGSLDEEFVALPENDDYRAVSPLAYELTVAKVSGGALVQGSCSMTISGICGRCLEPVETEVTAPDVELFIDLEECGEEVDISEDIREELLINLPMNLLCDEDCAGLCLECGNNLNKKECSCGKKSSGSLAWSALDDLNI
ncbi:MAG: DUF177 domain-containing protein [Lentisphaeria bacterium]|nr:DUF177 domain-containing protein [Lentisphaeria bacterium]MBO5764912.1 DUF177 domain-containing protein [Lentisphaeria bacterium]MBO5990547.1 DUF177 domain-containing protein [Lentisphaeria bacterium]MBR2632133.1 DUF177 domain-containing protein [Lentisphaeria bacterium]